MDTVYGSKKYFQTLATTDNDYYNRHSSSANRVMVSHNFFLFLFGWAFSSLVFVFYITLARHIINWRGWKCSQQSRINCWKLHNFRDGNREKKITRSNIVQPKRSEKKATKDRENVLSFLTIRQIRREHLRSRSNTLCPLFNVYDVKNLDHIINERGIDQEKPTTKSMMHGSSKTNNKCWRK